MGIVIQGRGILNQYSNNLTDVIHQESFIAHSLRVKRHSFT